MVLGRVQGEELPVTRLPGESFWAKAEEFEAASALQMVGGSLILKLSCIVCLKFMKSSKNLWTDWFFPQCACHEKGRIGGKEALIPPFREGPYMILNELLALCASKEVILTLFPVEGRGRRWRDLLRQPFITCISVSFCLPAANSNVVQILSSAACWNGSFLEKK